MPSSKALRRVGIADAWSLVRLLPKAEQRHISAILGHCIVKEPAFDASRSDIDQHAIVWPFMPVTHKASADVWLLIW